MSLPLQELAVDAKGANLYAETLEGVEATFALALREQPPISGDAAGSLVNAQIVASVQEAARPRQ